MNNQRGPKALISFALVAALIGASVPSFAAESYHPDREPQPAGTVAVTIDDGVYQADHSYIDVSALKERFANGREIWGSLTQCESLSKAPCDSSMANNKEREITAKLNMPVCESADQSFCIETVAIYEEGTASPPANFIRYNSGPTVPEDKARKLPNGSPVSLWAGTANHSGDGNTYAVQARAEFRYEKGSFRMDKLDLNVFPYLDVVAPNNRGFYWAVGQSGNQTVQGLSAGMAYSDSGSYGAIHDFDLATRVKLTLRVPNAIKGWLKGRATEPSFTATKGASFSRWVLDAKPVVVPKLRVVTTDENRTKTMREFPMWSDGRQGSWSSLYTSSEGQAAFDWIKELKPLAKDTAYAQTVVWQLGATSWGTGPCDARAKGISGFVLTNSMAYQGTAPKYQRGFIDYKVSGMHLLPDGSEAIGSYDLVMDSEVARCLYGFNKAPLSATITIAGDGEKEIATTVVSEKNGWLKLAAYGFTFSEKTIKVKLTQGKKTTITCVASGKKNVKVTAVTPRCPKGYKKR